MKITQDIIENGKHIVHAHYTKAELKEIREKHKDLMKKTKNEPTDK